MNAIVQEFTWSRGMDFNSYLCFLVENMLEL